MLSKVLLRGDCVVSDSMKLHGRGVGMWLRSPVWGHCPGLVGFFWSRQGLQHCNSGSPLQYVYSDSLVTKGSRHVLSIVLIRKLHNGQCYRYCRLAVGHLSHTRVCTTTLEMEGACLSGVVSQLTGSQKSVITTTTNQYLLSTLPTRMYGSCFSFFVWA